MRLLLVAASAAVAAASAGQCERQETCDLRERADAGDADAQNRYGMAVMSGDGVEADPEEAVRWFSKAVDLGNVDAMFNLGACYGRGMGVEGDLKRAAKLFRAASDGGHAGAAFSLGTMHAARQLSTGSSRIAAQKAAAKWYKKAADADHADAQYNYGAAFFNGEGVEKDEGQAVEWWKKAADGGHVEAAYSLAMLLTTGTEDTDKSAADGRVFLAKAAHGGHPAAQAAFGATLMQEGKEREGAEMLRKGAASGNAEAMYTLGTAVCLGIGTKEDAQAGLEWIEKSAEAGHKSAKELLKRCSGSRNDRAAQVTAVLRAQRAKFERRREAASQKK